ncbi:hypothetical protein [Polaromonas sp.]|uniref:hypothetical protein n=1 Tax=Polaromonas sp. TaxID=1869339 RepID=UPI003CB7B267
MPLKDTIETASAAAGNQSKLAAMIGVTPQNISDYKNGRLTCGLKKRIQIAEIAGVDRLRTIFEYFEDSLDATDEYEAQAKATIRAMLDAFPPETDQAPESKKPLGAKSSQGVSWRKRMDSNVDVAPQPGTKKPPEGGSLSWRKRRDSNPR